MIRAVQMTLDYEPRCRMAPQLPAAPVGSDARSRHSLLPSPARRQTHWPVSCIPFESDTGRSSERAEGSLVLEGEPRALRFVRSTSYSHSTKLRAANKVEPLCTPVRTRTLCPKHQTGQSSPVDAF